MSSDELTYIEVPVTLSELQRLKTAAILTASGMPWEALRLQAGLPRIGKLITQIEVESEMTGVPTLAAVARVSEYGVRESIQFTNSERGTQFMVGHIAVWISNELVSEFIRELDAKCLLSVFETIRDSAYADGYEDGRADARDEDDA